MLIDKLAYCSKLKGIHPGLKLLFSVGMLFICVWADSAIISAFCIILMGTLITLRGGVSLSYYIKLMKIPLIFIMLSVVAILAEISPKPIGMLNIAAFGKYICVTQRGIIYCARLTLKAFGAVSCLYFLSLSTPMNDVLWAFGKMRCPQMVLELMLLIYRFIFILMEVSYEMNISQKSRLGNVSLRAQFRSFSGRGISLFIYSMKRSGELYNSMVSRLYDGKIKVIGEKYSAPKIMWLEAVFFEAAVAAVSVFIKKSSLVGIL